MKYILALCLSVFFLFFTKVYANIDEFQSNYIVEKAVGFGLSKRRAKLNAYENFIVKIFNEEVLVELKFHDNPILAENALFLTKAMRKIVLDSIEYKTPYYASDLYQGEVRLRRDKLEQIYNLVEPRISFNLLDISTNDRYIAVLESAQLAMIFFAVSNNTDTDRDREILSNILQRVDYYTQKDTTGLAVFPEYIFEQGTLKINNSQITSNEVFLSQGKHKFVLDMQDHFPVIGYFYMEKSTVKKIPVTLIRRPEGIIPVAIKSNFSNQLLRSKRLILESYGWDIDENAGFIIESQFQYENEKLANNFVKRRVQVSFRIGEKGVDKERQTYFLKPSTAIYEREYSNEFVYSQNDLATLARQQRLLVIKSLLEFLSNFDQQDYRFLYFSEAQE